MILEIWVLGKKLDLYSKSNMKHTLQINDIAEIKDRQASFTNSFSIPRTSNNIKLLDGLGVPSDTSRLPYTKPNCQVKLDGFDFLVSGWLNVSETDDEYKIYVYSGIINFFKAIENKTLGDLDLSEVEHEKNLATVVASFTNPFYKYLITDYNGLTHYGASNQIINIDYLIPSVSVKYLWDKIHSTFLYDYEGDLFTTQDFTNFWLTYPKPITIDVLNPVTTNNGSLYLANVNQPTNDPNLHYRQLTTFGYVNNVYFVAPEDGTYKLTFHIECNKAFGTKNYYYSVNQEGVPFASRNYTYLTNTSNGGGTADVAVTVTLNAGDQVSFVMYYPQINGAFQENHVYTITWELFDAGDASFSTELKDFLISDFIKEVINRFALTIISSEFDLNTIKYRTFKERVNTNKIKDWSNKYIQRTEEKYVYNSYAQRNLFTYQYSDKELTYNNSSINIANVNLSELKTLFASKTYSPEPDFVDFYVGSEGMKKLKVFKLYDKSVKDQGGVTKIDYKPLDKRFHFCKAQQIVSTVTIGSQVLGNSQTVSNFYLASFTGCDWSSLLTKFYPEMGQVLNDSRIHQISLNLNIMDFLDFDFDSLIFFEQEQQYYIPNKIQIDYDSGKASGEFVRVKKEKDTTDVPVDPTETKLEIKWGDDTVIPKSGTNSTEVMKITLIQFPVTDEINIFEWQRFDGTNWTGLGTGVTPYTASVNIGFQKFRLKGTSVNSNIFYSNELEVTRINYTCVRYYAWSSGNASGDTLYVYYMDCNGESQVASTYTTTPGSYLDLQVCAVQGSATVSGNQSAQIEEQGPC